MSDSFSKDLRLVLTVFALTVLFLYGFLSAYLKIFPYNILEPHIRVYANYVSSLNVDYTNNDWRWYVDEGLPKGFSVSDTNQMSQDYLFYVSTADTSARLIDNAGGLVHKWTLDVEALWPDQAHIRAPKKVPFDYFTLRDFHVFPDGRLVVIVSMYGATPWGAGLVMMDKDSNVLWSQQGSYYNDLHVDDAGNIYALRHDIILESDEENFDMNINFQTPYLRDVVVRLDQDGKIIEEYAVVDMLRTSEWKNIEPYIMEEGKGDYTHTNSVTIVESNVDLPSFLKAGDLLAIVRNMDLLVAIDTVNKKIRWATRLPVRMPHDIDVLQNGNFLIYDNQGHLGAEGYSRVVELDPETLGVEWSYVGSKEQPFESEFWGFQQRLENGNTLTVVPHKSRIIEVNSDGDVVMEYYVPDRKEEGGIVYNPVVTSAGRVSPNALTFLNKEEL